MKFKNRKSAPLLLYPAMKNLPIFLTIFLTLFLSLASAKPTIFYPVTEFGAVGDGKTLNTQAIQQAIDAAAKAGGGTVVFPAGRYLSGTICLRSHITLELQAGSVLLGSTRVADYPVHFTNYPAWSDQ
jgi:polygalacturonase